MQHNSKGLYRLMWDSEEQGLAKEEHQGPHHDVGAEQRPRNGIPLVLSPVEQDVPDPWTIFQCFMVH